MLLEGESRGGLILVSVSSLRLRSALWIFKNYDRRAYVETKELRCNGDDSLQTFASSSKQGYKQ